MVVSSAFFSFCFLALTGVTTRLGVTGTTGTAGFTFDDAFRDIDGGGCSANDLGIAGILGMAGTAGSEKPGGMIGVALRGCSKVCVITGATPGRGKSMSSTKALIDASSSGLKRVSSSIHNNH
jgi:hypothetical protein